MSWLSVWVCCLFKCWATMQKSRLIGSMSQPQLNRNSKCSIRCGEWIQCKSQHHYWRMKKNMNKKMKWNEHQRLRQWHANRMDQEWVRTKWKQIATNEIAVCRKAWSVSETNVDWIVWVCVYFLHVCLLVPNKMNLSRMNMKKRTHTHARTHHLADGEVQTAVPNRTYTHAHSHAPTQSHIKSDQTGENIRSDRL